MLVDRTILYCDGGRELVIAVLKACNYYIGHSTLVGQCPMKSLWSTCLSIRPSLTFLKIGSLVFSFIVHDDSWPWYLVTAEARFFKKKKKKILTTGIWAKWAKIGLDIRFFDYLLKFCSLVFLGIAWNDSLQ